jgi:class 3 adenylate cyclase
MLDELLEKLPTGQDMLALTPQQLDEVLLSCFLQRVDNTKGPIPGPRFFSIEELENLYSVGIGLPFAQLQKINSLLMEACQRLLAGGYIMLAPGQYGAMTVTTKGKRGLPPEFSTSTLLEWAGKERATLAIVFTDIVDSTATGRMLGDETMNQVWEAHFTKSRKLIAAHGGRWIKNLGDGDLAVFRTVEDALDYTLALRGDCGPSMLRLRAAIHIGPVHVVAEDIRGDAVNFAARVGGANKGAEIWLSNDAISHLVALKAARHKNLRWCDHPGVELKGLGAHTLWSLAPPGAGQSLAEIGVQIGASPRHVPPPAEPQPILRISTGEAGAYVQTRGRNRYSTERTLNLRLDNISQNHAVTGIKVAILGIEPQSEYVGPWTLAEPLSLAVGDHTFIPLASYQEAANSAGYSTSRYECSATFFEVLSDKNRAKPPRDIPQLITIRATGFNTAPCDYQCTVWVDRSDGRLRIGETSETNGIDSPTETLPRRFTDRSPEHLLAFYVGQTALQADKRMEPFKGMWIRTEGVITLLAADGKGAVCMPRRGQLGTGRSVECRFSEKWVTALSRYDNGETLEVVGRIAPWQNGAQLYVLDCELPDN